MQLTLTLYQQNENNAMLKIRPVNTNDYDSICSFPQDADELFYMFPKATFPLTTDQLVESISKRQDSTVIESDGIVAGFANFYKWEIGGTCSIGNFVICKNFRRAGVGRALINGMLRIAKEKYKADSIHVSCFNLNTSGLILYSKFGFIPYEFERRLSKSGNEIVLIHMKYDLSIDNSNVKIRRFIKEDVDNIQRLASKKVNSDKTNVPFPYPEGGADKYQQIVDENWNNGLSREFVVEYCGSVIGMAGILYLCDEQQEPQIGYWIDEAYRNKGIGSLIVKWLKEYSVNELKLSRINAHVFKTNIGSIKVLERNGFIAKDSFRLPCDHFKYPNELMINYEYKNVV